ncbi:hypothetical protein V8G54_022366, partial [Vigna mungo]
MEEEVQHGVEQVGGVSEEMTDVDGEVEVETVMEEEVHELEVIGGITKERVDVDGEVEVEVAIEEDKVDFDGQVQGEEVHRVQKERVDHDEDIEEEVDVRNGDIVAEWSGNVEVEVQSVSHEFNGPCSRETSDNMFEVNVEGENER